MDENFEKIMKANGFVSDAEQAAVDNIFIELNAIAAKVGAPPAFYKVDGGYQMHPGLYQLLKDNPELLA